MLLHHNIDNLALDNDNLLGLLICQPLLRPLRGYDMLNDVVLCEVLKLNLENEGYDVDTAFSAEQALG